MKGLSGNVGIWSDKDDAHFNDCFVIDYTVGMRMLGTANRISRCHVWGGTVPPKNLSVQDWSEIYGKRKKQLWAGVYGQDADKAEAENDVPEMLIGSIAFDIKGFNNILDGCYADTTEIGFQTENYTRIVGCNFFNNRLMGLKKSSAINHIGGRLTVTMCVFRSTVGTEILYNGSKEDVEWVSNTVRGFAKIPFEK